MTFSGFGVLSLIIQFVWPNSGDYNLSNILSSSSLTIIIAFFTLKSHKSWRKFNKMQLLILLSFSSWLVAELLFGYYDGFLKANPYPSVADLFYFIGYLFFILLLRYLNKTHKIELRLIISSLITFSFFVFYILYVSIFIFNINITRENLLDLILIFVYPFFDLVIVVAGVIYFFRAKDISLNREYLTWAFVAICGLFFFIADLTFGLDDLFDPVLKYHFTDLFSTIGYIIAGTAILIRVYYADQINSKL